MGTLKFVIDFDSAFTTIYKLGSGVVLREHTVATVDANGKKGLKAFGDEARKLIGKTGENSKVVFPVFEGEIVNETVAGLLLKEFLKKAGAESVFNSVFCIFSVPCGLSNESLQKYENVANIAGVSKFSFVEAPILSALGSHVPITEATPFFLVDMKGGITNIAVLSLDGIISGFSVNFGVNKINTDIIDYIVDNYNLQIGLLSAERIKNEIGSLDENDGLSTIVNGRDTKTGNPKSISLRAVDLIEPVKKYFDKIIDLSYSLLSKLPPEVSAEIRHSGINLSGDGCKIYGLVNYFEKKFDIKINISENPEYDICLGGGVLLGNKHLLKKVMIKN